MVWLRRIAYVIATITIFGSSAYYWLIVESHMPSSGTFDIDLDEVRKLADADAGEKPVEIRYETVGTITFPKTAVVAGDGWEPTLLPVSAYQIVFPDRTAIIDTAYDEVTAKRADAPNSGYDHAAYDRIVAGLNKASLIVITHEHWDHAATLFAQPNLPKLLQVTKLTKEQVDNSDRLIPSNFPSGARSSYTPVTYNHYLSVAPGIVLIKAPGHTPGSQMVYVRTANGTEYLFLGDVAWHQRNIDVLRERARLVTWLFLNEDRDAVMLELSQIRKLQELNPNLVIVPGHDLDKMIALHDKKLLVNHFQ
ncbi:MAG: MBL fold metallo-hydrolase [Micropepsaceae bacterium]